jgi:hypothetical protein
VIEAEPKPKHHDKQLRSPIMADTRDSKKASLINQNLASKESPLKRVVLDMKYKENVD